MKKRWGIVVGIIVAVVVGLSFHHHRVTHFKKNPFLVEIQAVATQNWQPSIEAYGTVNAVQGVDISSDVAGKIDQIDFKSGQRVAAGAVLVMLENDDLKATLAEDQAKLYLAHTQMQEMQYLYREGAESRLANDTAVANYDQDLAVVQFDQAKLDKTYIRSPFAGTVGLNTVNLGQYISPGTVIANVQQTTGLYVDFSVPQDQTLTAKVGDKVTVQIDNQSTPILGTLTAFNSAVDQDTRTLTMRASIPAGADLRPGTYVLVKLFLGESKPYPTIPETAIIYNPTTEGVYVVKAGHAQLTAIQVGTRKDGLAQVTSGLNLGDEVVVAGQDLLFSGAPVQVRSAVGEENVQ